VPRSASQAGRSSARYLGFAVPLVSEQFTI